MRAFQRLRPWFAALALASVLGPAVAADGGETGRLIEVKLGLSTLNATDRATLWRRVDEYATVDALQEFCGKKLNLQRRTWAAVSPCVDVASLRKVAAVFRNKKAEYVKNWETANPDAEKKKAVCATWNAKLIEYSKILDSHIAEARSMCDACLLC
jgi:hypothetical protein